MNICMCNCTYEWMVCKRVFLCGMLPWAAQGVDQPNHHLPHLGQFIDQGMRVVVEGPFLTRYVSEWKIRKIQVDGMVGNGWGFSVLGAHCAHTEEV